MSGGSYIGRGLAGWDSLWPERSRLGGAAGRNICARLCDNTTGGSSQALRPALSPGACDWRGRSCPAIDVGISADVRMEVAALMLTAKDLSEWRETLRVWQRTGDVLGLAEIMALLEPEEREQIWAMVPDHHTPRAEVERLLSSSV